MAQQFELSSPETPGTEESIVINGLSVGTTYYFAVKSSDYFGNTSEMPS